MFCTYPVGRWLQRKEVKKMTKILDLMRITSRNKLKYLILSVTSAVLAFNSFAYQQPLLGLASIALSAVLLYVCIYKYQRDYKHQLNNQSLQVTLGRVS